MTTDFEVIEQNETESVVSAIAVQNQRLADIAAPLLDRGFNPQGVDSSFGANTAAAVRAFQESTHGQLTVDGMTPELVSAVQPESDRWLGIMRFNIDRDSWCKARVARLAL